VVDGPVVLDAHSYGGIIATAVGPNLMIARPGEVLEGVGLAMMLGGPALYLPART
jgi:hypothetical protein